jgi:hypothetical protein
MKTKLVLPTIKIIASTQVDWPIFVRTINDLTGRSPTRELDAQGVPVGNFGSYLSALSYFQNSDRATIVPHFNVLHHASVSFLCDMPEHDFCKLMIAGHELKILIAPEGAFIFSGSLAAWKNEVILKSKSITEPSVRLFYNLIFMLFVVQLKMNLWVGYTKTEFPDGTFILS